MDLSLSMDFQTMAQNYYLRLKESFGKINKNIANYMKLLISNNMNDKFNQFTKELKKDDKTELSFRKIALARKRANINVNDYITELNKFLEKFPNEKEIWIELG